MKPVIALVGRPNVGKSTLFNRLTKTRDAIVADYAGLTRDRHYGNGKLGPHEYIVIDTGGFEPDAITGIYKEMARQTRQAVAESDVVIFVVDLLIALIYAVAVGALNWAPSDRLKAKAAKVKIGSPNMNIADITRFNNIEELVVDPTGHIPAQSSGRVKSKTPTTSTFKQE